jgi:hypothetical protein
MSDAAAPAVKALACPSCGAPVELKAAGYTVSVVCAHCGSTLDALSPELTLIDEVSGLSRVSRIPLGTRGELQGITWDAVGYMERDTGSSQWSEYLLFNPYYGYRFLIDDGRRWSLARLIDGEPSSVGIRQRALGNLRFKLFEDPYDASVSFVMGEFYWRVTRGETVRVTDYAGSGVMLSKEETESEVTWSRVDLLNVGEAEKAFGISAKSTFGTQPSPHEPSPWRQIMGPTYGTAAVALAVLAILCFMKPKSVDLGGAVLPSQLDQPEKSVTIADITLPRPTNRVDIHLQGQNLDNEWIDADLSLVNKATQQSYDAYALTEHYSGRDSDGNWSEGNSDRDVILSKVPQGQYDLVVDYSSHLWTGANTYPSATSAWTGSTSVSGAEADRPGPPLAVDVRTGGMGGWNLVLAVLAILAGPAVLMAANHGFEQRRRN